MNRCIAVSLAGVFALCRLVGAVCTPQTYSGCPASCATGDISGTTPGVHSVCSVVYNSNQSSADLMDVYYPSGLSSAQLAALPQDIVIHGGGWSSGSRTGAIWFATSPSSAAYILWVERTGHVVKAIDYRLTGTVSGQSVPNPWPAQWQDARCALWYVVGDGAGNPMDIHLWGQSAGAQMVASLVLTTDSTYSMAGCSASSATAGTNYRISSVYADATPWDLATGGSNSAYALTGTTSVMYPAANAVLNCVPVSGVNNANLSACESADNSLGFSPSLYATANNPGLKVRIMWRVGAGPLASNPSDASYCDPQIDPTVDGIAADASYASLGFATSTTLFWWTPVQHDPVHVGDCDPAINIGPTGAGGMGGWCMQRSMFFSVNQQRARPSGGSAHFGSNVGFF